MQYKKIKLFSDSTCDLPKALIEEMGVEIVPLYVNFGEVQFKDGIDLMQNDLYAQVEKHGSLPKTAAPSPMDYEEAFRPFVEKDYDILYIGLSSKMSASCQNAKIAAEEFPGARILVHDSMNLSTGIGLQVCAAYDAISEGIPLEGVIEVLREVALHIKTAFTVESLEYLYKGGRCNAVQALLSGMLHIMPIIKVVEGSMIVGNKVRGKKIKALDFMIEGALVHKDSLLYGRMFIPYTSGSEEEAIYIQKQLEEQIPNIKIYKTMAGCVIASHCGKKTIGLMYIAKE